MNPIKSKSLYFFIAFMVLLPVSCVGVKRLSTDKVEDISGRWNDTDARMVAEEMAKDIVSRAWYNRFMADQQRKPVLIIGDILNKSHEHIDAEPFIKDIEIDLINSQSVQLINHGAFREKLRSQRQDQNQNSEAGKDIQKQVGHELGADFMLFGHINTIVDSSEKGKRKVVFYQVTLELTHLTTNEIVWIGSKKIKKYVRKR